MKKLLKILIVVTILLTGYLTSSLNMRGPYAAAADNGLFTQVCNNKNGSGQGASSVCQDAQNQTANKGNPIAGKNGILHKVTLILSLVGGIAAIILLVLSGLTMVTSAGNSEKVASARRRIVYAVIGLIVISLAYIIVDYVNVHFVTT